MKTRLLLVLTLFAMQVSAALQLGTLSQSRSSENSTVLFGEAAQRTSSLILGSVSRSESSLEQSILSEDTLVLHLFNDLTVKTVVENITTLSNGSLLWKGTNIAGEDGYTQFILSKGILTGNVYSSDLVYHLSGKSPTVVGITEINPTKLPNETTETCGEDHSHYDEVEKTPLYGPRTRSAQNPVIDILIVYPQELVTQLGGEATIEAEVEYRIAEANMIMENSNMRTRFRLVHHDVVTDIPTAALSASNDVNPSLQAQALRDEYGADLVAHWNIGGTAGSGNNYTGNENRAYNTSNYLNVVSQYTFVHECGHNLGAKHNRQAYSTVYGSDEYRFGYLFDFGDNTGRTVMAYNNCSEVGIYGSCTRMPYFSNPTLSYESASALGIHPPHSNASYNARRIDEVAVYVEEFRNSKDAVLTYLLTVNGGTGTGEYNEDVSFDITANDSSSVGKEFSHWIGDTHILNSIYSPTVTVTMPSYDVAVSAVYEESTVSEFNLTVTSGIGGGVYQEGTHVTIAADEISGKQFVRWSGDTSGLNIEGSPTTFLMPDSDITLSAEYEERYTLDTSNLSDNLVSLFNWNTISDTYGSEIVVNTTLLQSDEEISAHVTLAADNVAANEYSWGKLSGYFDSTMNEVTVVKITYSANAPVQLILEQDLLSEAGVAYYYLLPATNGSEESLYLPIDHFEQPTWEGSLEVPLDLSKVSSVSFQPDEKEKKVSFSISELRFTNFTYEQQAVAISHNRIQKKLLGIESITTQAIAFSVPSDGVYDLTLFTLNGRIIITQSTDLRAGVARIPIQNNNSGMYLFRIKGESVNYLQKIVIK